MRCRSVVVVLGLAAAAGACGGSAEVDDAIWVIDPSAVDFEVTGASLEEWGFLSTDFDREVLSAARMFVDVDTHDDDDSIHTDLRVTIEPAPIDAPAGDEASLALSGLERVEIDGGSLVLKDFGYLASISDLGFDTSISTSTQGLTRDEHIELVESIRFEDGRLVTPWQEQRGWIDIGSRLTQIRIGVGSRGGEAIFGSSEVTYGAPASTEAAWDDITNLGADGVRLVFVPVTEENPAMAGGHALFEEESAPIETIDGGRDALVSSPASSRAYVVWRNRGSWLILSSVSMNVDELVEVAASVRPATDQERNVIEALASAAD